MHWCRNPAKLLGLGWKYPSPRSAPHLLSIDSTHRCKNCFLFVPSHPRETWFSRQQSQCVSVFNPLLARGMLETLFIIHRAKLLLPISPHPMDQQGSPCCLNFLAVTSSYHSKVYLVGALDAEKLAAAVLLYVL